MLFVVMEIANLKICFPQLDNGRKVMEKFKSVWKSRRVWVAVAGVAVACAHTLGVEVDPETVQYVVLLAASWIVGDSLRKTE